MTVKCGYFCVHFCPLLLSCSHSLHLMTHTSHSMFLTLARSLLYQRNPGKESRRKLWDDAWSIQRTTNWKITLKTIMCHLLILCPTASHFTFQPLSNLYNGDNTCIVRLFWGLNKKTINQTLLRSLLAHGRGSQNGNYSLGHRHCVLTCVLGWHHWLGIQGS